MQIKIFNIPIPDSEKMNDEMNYFLCSKKVLQTETHLGNSGGGTFWCFCIKYLDEVSKISRKKVDYKQTLDKESYQRHALPLVAFTQHTDSKLLRQNVLGHLGGAFG